MNTTAPTAKLEEEANHFEYTTRYGVAEILEMRGITMDDVLEAEASGTAVCVKIPSASEANLSPALVRAVFNGEVR